MTVYDILKAEGSTRAFILGMAKNAGKTFTLNHIVRSAAARGETLGLTSTGRDGEPLDLVTGKAKPRILCPAGTVVGTASMALEKSSASFCDEEPTGIETVLGEVIVATVETEGLVELSGPLFAGELGRLLDLMEERGPPMILVDGSLDRKAASRVVGDIVLAVGAVISRDLDEVVRKAAAFVEQICIPVAPEWVKRALSSDAKSGALLFEDGRVEKLPFGTLLGRRRELLEIIEQRSPWAVFMSGAVGEDTFSAISRIDGPVRLIVTSASSIFAGYSDWIRFVSEGKECYALEPLRLRAVTVNPYSPEGWELPAEELAGAIAEALAPIPVLDPGACLDSTLAGGDDEVG